MIGVEGSWEATFQINEVDIIAEPEDLMSFTLVEESGNLLPVWSIEFQSMDDDLVQHWNEGNCIDVLLGHDDSTKMRVSLHIVSPHKSEDSGQKRRFTATGLYDALPYVNTPHVRILGATSAVEICKAVVSNYFTWDEEINLKKSKDKMGYVQPNVCDKKYVDHLMQHAYLPNSYVGSGITSEGKFRVVDVKEVLSKEPKWHIGNAEGQGGANFLLAIGAPKYINNTALLNPLIGYGVEKPMIDLTTGSRIVHKPKPNLAATQSDKIPRTVEVERRTQSPEFLTSSMDTNYHVAASNNFMGLANLSNNVVDVTLDCGYQPISVWDTVMYQVYKSDMETLDDTYSGKYVVGKISRHIQGASNRLLTRILMFREAPNNMEGAVHE